MSALGVQLGPDTGPGLLENGECCQDHQQLVAAEVTTHAASCQKSNESLSLLKAPRESNPTDSCPCDCSVSLHAAFPRCGYANRASNALFPTPELFHGLVTLVFLAPRTGPAPASARAAAMVVAVYFALPVDDVGHVASAVDLE